MVDVGHPFAETFGSMGNPLLFEPGAVFEQRLVEVLGTVQGNMAVSDREGPEGFFRRVAKLHQPV